MSAVAVAVRIPFDTVREDELRLIRIVIIDHAVHVDIHLDKHAENPACPHLSRLIVFDSRVQGDMVQLVDITDGMTIAVVRVAGCHEEWRTFKRRLLSFLVCAVIPFAVADDAEADAPLCEYQQKCSWRFAGIDVVGRTGVAVGAESHHAATETVHTGEAAGWNIHAVLADGAVGDAGERVVVGGEEGEVGISARNGVICVR